MSAGAHHDLSTASSFYLPVITDGLPLREGKPREEQGLGLDMNRFGLKALPEGTVYATITPIKEPVPLVDSNGEPLEDTLKGYPPVLTPKQVSEILQISLTNVRAKCRNGEIPCLKFGAQWRITKAALIEFLKG